MAATIRSPSTSTPKNGGAVAETVATPMDATDGGHAGGEAAPAKTAARSALPVESGHAADSDLAGHSSSDSAIGQEQGARRQTTNTPRAQAFTPSTWSPMHPTPTCSRWGPSQHMPATRRPLSTRQPERMELPTASGRRSPRSRLRPSTQHAISAIGQREALLRGTLAQHRAAIGTVAASQAALARSPRCICLTESLLNYIRKSGKNYKRIRLVSCWTGKHAQGTSSATMCNCPTSSSATWSGRAGAFPMRSTPPLFNLLG